MRRTMPLGYCRLGLEGFLVEVSVVACRMLMVERSIGGDFVRRNGGGEIGSWPLFRLRRARRSCSICFRSMPILPIAFVGLAGSGGPISNGLAGKSTLLVSSRDNAMARLRSSSSPSDCVRSIGLDMFLALCFCDWAVLGALAENTADEATLLISLRLSAVWIVDLTLQKRDSQGFIYPNWRMLLDAFISCECKHSVRLRMLYDFV